MRASTTPLVGRRGELAALDSLVRATGRDPVRLAAVWGPPGIGKTALALAWVRRVGHRFPDGHVYVDLALDATDDPGVAKESGVADDPTIPKEPSAAKEPSLAEEPDGDGTTRRLLAALGTPDIRGHSGGDEGSPNAALADRIGRFRASLAGRRALVVFDGVASAEQVRPLLPGAPGCRTVVLSRNDLSRLVELDGARPLPLGGLSPVAARQLLASRLGPARLRRDPEAVERLVAACDGRPGALVRAAAAAARRPDDPLWTFVAAQPLTAPPTMPRMK